MTSKKVKNRTLKAADLAAGVIPPGFSGRPAGGDLTGAYPDPTIASGRVTSEKVADGAVSGPDLGAGSVDGSKALCNNSAVNHDPPAITVNFTVFDN